MQHPLKNRKTFAIFIALAAIIAFSVYPPFRSQAQRKQTPPTEKQEPGDTTRRKSTAPGNTNKTYDEVRIELDRATRELDSELKRLQELELPKVQEEISRAMRELDLSKIQVIANKAVQDIDFDSIEKEIASNLREIESEEWQHRLRTELERVDLKKLKQQLEEMKSKNHLEIQRELEKVRNDLNRSRIDAEATMKDARIQIEKAREELKLMQAGLDELERDGIIKNDDPAAIEWDGDVLIVNGKRQSRAVSDKYRTYFKNGKYSFHHKSPQIVL